MPITRVPNAPPSVEGVINLRGRIIPVIDLRKKFGITPAAEKVDERIIVVELGGDGRVLGFTVDRVNQVLRLGRDIVDRFVAAFTAADVGALHALLVEDVDATVFPAGVGRGADHLIEAGWIRGSLFHHDPECEASGRPYPSRLSVEVIGGEPVVLVERAERGGDEMLLEEVWRFEGEEGRIHRVQDYCFCPDLVAWIGHQAGLPTRSAGYQFGVVIGAE